MTPGRLSAHSIASKGACRRKHTHPSTKVRRRHKPAARTRSTRKHSMPTRRSRTSAKPQGWPARDTRAQRLVCNGRRKRSIGDVLNERGVQRMQWHVATRTRCRPIYTAASMERPSPLAIRAVWPAANGRRHGRCAQLATSSVRLASQGRVSQGRTRQGRTGQGRASRGRASQGTSEGRASQGRASRMVAATSSLPRQYA